MSYYMAGDYYRSGDFLGIGGFISNTLGSILPGPLGAAAKIVGGGIQGIGGRKPPVLFAPGTTPLVGPGSGPAGPTPGVSGALERFLPGGQSGYVCPTGGGGHVNKTDYWLKDGTYVPAGSRIVKNRRMNPGNASALRRSIRREQAFVGLAKRVLRGTGLTVKRTGGLARKKTTRRR